MKRRSRYQCESNIGFSSRALLVLGFLLMYGIRLPACSCDTIPFKPALESADEVFVGEIVKADLFVSEVYLDSQGEERTEWSWRYHFEVGHKWKGTKAGELIVVVTKLIKRKAKA